MVHTRLVRNSLFINILRIIKWLASKRELKRRVLLMTNLISRYSTDAVNVFLLKREFYYSTFVLYSFRVHRADKPAGTNGHYHIHTHYSVLVGIDHGRLRTTHAYKPNYYVLSHVNFKYWPKYFASVQGPRPHSCAPVLRWARSSYLRRIQYETYLSKSMYLHKYWYNKVQEEWLVTGIALAVWKWTGS